MGFGEEGSGSVCQCPGSCSVEECRKHQAFIQSRFLLVHEAWGLPDFNGDGVEGLVGG